MSLSMLNNFLPFTNVGFVETLSSICDKLGMILNPHNMSSKKTYTRYDT
jgi:hypothetical protein